MARLGGFVACTAVALAGCAGDFAGETLSHDHPAHPRAAAAPLPPVAEVLRIDEQQTRASAAAEGDGDPATAGASGHGHHEHGGADRAEAAATAPPAATAPAQAAAYVCPMHAEVTSDSPGRCPKCFMSLVPVRSDAGDGGGS